MIIVYGFFAVLALLIAGAAFRQKKNERIAFAVSAFVFSCLMYQLAGFAHSLSYNIWYSSATDKLLEASIGALEEKREGQLLNELKSLRENLVVTYEFKGDYPEQALEAVENLTITAEPGEVVNASSAAGLSENHLHD
ncbi:hypothetical protein QEH59_18160 [Coraliomargarita sp. SDUM461004]|uniref:Uncharacterized protein n=1 Tax=Thalassobacterium sedimentorum TaxID=3041258 RepID=A0ABU1AR50_9BACT|nr:hypothetical protein [Coraliomargarita sp. SDUM461004]MDQ8196360.1 hypothetical protein [Coraliomargarita sp. SDUM461004]